MERVGRLRQAHSYCTAALLEACVREEDAYADMMSCLEGGLMSVWGEQRLEQSQEQCFFPESLRVPAKLASSHAAERL